MAKDDITRGGKRKQHEPVYMLLEIQVDDKLNVKSIIGALPIPELLPRQSNEPMGKRVARTLQHCSQNGNTDYDNKWFAVVSISWEPFTLRQETKTVICSRTPQ